MGTIIESTEIRSFGYSRRRLGVLRLATTGAMVAVIALVFCWLGTFLPLDRATEGVIGIFTQKASGSIAALLEGSACALVVGAAVGGLTALAYNALGALD